MAGTVAVVLNPVGGRGVAARRWPEVEVALRDILGDRLVAVERTTGPGSATEQAARLAADGTDIILAAGGDGTIGQVMQGLLGGPAMLAVLPLGTGNDIARMLGFGSDWQSAVRAVAIGHTINADVGRWSQAGQTGHFLNAAGCGFDAAVAERINTGFRWVRGTGAYIGAVLQTLGSYRATELTIDVDGEKIRGKAMLCALANTCSYGGGMKIAPHADMTDGQLDLVLVGDVSTMEFLKAFPKVFKGTHLDHPQVRHRTFKRVSVTSDPPVPFLVDGELRPAEQVVVEVVPAAVRLVVPPGSSQLPS